MIPASTATNKISDDNFEELQISDNEIENEYSYDYEENGNCVDYIDFGFR